MNDDDDTPDWVYLTMDQTSRMDGRPVPAATVLLYRVCDNDTKKFAEAMRLVRLFVDQAKKE